VCALSYTIQREAIVARALADQVLAPHVEDPGVLKDPEVAVSDFDKWLNERPPEADRPWQHLELESLLFPGRR
jgi:hypothetical protein